jgi:hypothetical protein
MTAARRSPPQRLADGRVYVARDTEAYRLWNVYWRRTKGVSAPRLPDGRGWYFPSQFPPSAEPAKHWQDRS